MPYLFVFLISLVGSMIQTATGFAFSIVQMALYPLFLPYKTSLMLASIVSTMQTAVVSVKHRKHINWKLLVYPFCAFLVTSAAAVWLLTGTPDAIVKQILGVILILLSAYFLFFSKKIKLKAGPLMGVATGGLSGVLGGLFGMFGPPIVLYMTAATSDPLVYLSTIHMFFLFSNVSNMTMRFAAGYASLDMWGLVLSGLAGALLGILVGSVALKRIKPSILRMAVYVLMIAVGVWFALGN